MQLPNIETDLISNDPCDIIGFEAEVRTALLIRRTEQKLLELFSEGLLFGTVHTSIGQEFVGVSIARALEKVDSIFSNHRGHGHYLARFDDVDGLIAEVMGKSTGVCAGRGGSQHLQRDSYYSNGIQGGIVPVATGLGFAHKHQQTGGISVVFLGDGTLGQGAVYESLNIASKWSLPVLFVCENNFFAQSTSQRQTLAGDICARADAFGVETVHADTWDWRSLCSKMRNAVETVRQQSRPVFARVDTFRLMAHSKGDDNRPKEYVDQYWGKDPLNRIEESIGDGAVWKELVRGIDERIERAVEQAKLADFDTISVPGNATGDVGKTDWKPASFARKRVVQSINAGLRDAMQADERIVLIGEDIESPYGGAFKCTKDLSVDFPGRVFNTPISEQAIVGIGNGIALGGQIPVVEVMFGDFMTLAMDQWVNHAAKFRFMFNDKVRIPLVIRTPMGGKRGYASTHSQSLEKHFVGLPDTQVFCLHHRMGADSFYRELLDSVDRPTLVIENKLLYGQFASSEPAQGFELVVTGDEPGTTTCLKPCIQPDITIVAIGGVAIDAEAAVEQLFVDDEIAAELIMPAQLYPMDLAPILDSIQRSGRLLVVEEGQSFGSIGAEILAQVGEMGLQTQVARIAAAPVPIPAARPLEAECLPGLDDIVAATKQLVSS